VEKGRKYRKVPVKGSGRAIGGLGIRGERIFDVEDKCIALGKSDE